VGESCFKAQITNSVDAFYHKIVILLTKCLPNYISGKKVSCLINCISMGLFDNPV